MTYLLAIGDRAYSSWSLRGWLAFARFGIPIRTRFARLYAPETPPMLAADFDGARTVPALLVAGEGGPAFAVWDSLAIGETLAERHPEAGHWPTVPAARGRARALAAEMHSGFSALRGACPMNLRRAYQGFEPDAAVLTDLARLEALWLPVLEASGGPWLFGAYSLADAFFAPVAARVATYDLPVCAVASNYVAAHLACPQFRRWRAQGLADPVVQAVYDMNLPERPWPGPAPLPARPLAEGKPVNATCPFSGDPVRADSLAEVAGTVVGFCNPGCRDKVVADPEAWPEAMALALARERAS